AGEGGPHPVTDRDRPGGEPSVAPPAIVVVVVRAGDGGEGEDCDYGEDAMTCEKGTHHELRVGGRRLLRVRVAAGFFADQAAARRVSNACGRRSGSATFPVPDRRRRLKGMNVRIRRRWLRHLLACALAAGCGGTTA